MGLKERLKLVKFTVRITIKLAILFCFFCLFFSFLFEKIVIGVAIIC